MKTSEFIEKIKELGLRTVEYPDSSEISIYDVGILLATVDKYNQYNINTSYGYDIKFNIFNNNCWSKLLDILVDYAKTPIEERKEAKS